MTDYNIRMEPFNCRYVNERNRGLWYPAHDYSRSLETLRDQRNHNHSPSLAYSINRFVSISIL